MDAAIGAIKNTVPISMFNRGLAGKIFDEVKHSGVKVVMRNNAPEAVIVSTEKYLRDQEELENLRLLLLARERIEHADPSAYVSQEAIDSKYGYTEDDFQGYEEVEFE